MSKLELEKEIHEEEFDFFRVKKIREKNKGSIYKDMVFAILFPPIAMIALLLGWALANHIWENAIGNETKHVPHYKEMQYNQKLNKDLERQKLNDAHLRKLSLGDIVR